MPTTRQLVSLRNLLLTTNDLRNPSDLEGQFRNATGLSLDTAKGLTTLLQVGWIWHVRHLWPTCT